MIARFPTRSPVASWIFALSLFLPTIYPGSDALWVPALILWFFRTSRLRVYREDILLLVFIGGVILQTSLGFFWRPPDSVPWSPVPFAYLMIPVCMLVGRSLNRTTIRCLVALICAEAVVCGIQLILRQPYVFEGQRQAILNVGLTEWGSSDLLYFNRTYGLSTNSSVAAQKFLLAVLLLFEPSLKRWRWRPVVFLLLALGLYATFNRSTIVVLGIFFSYKAFARLLQSATSLRRQLQLLALGVFLVTLAIIYLPRLEAQFLRGNSEQSLLEDSGRRIFWDLGRTSISTHPIVGQLSQRLMLYDPAYDRWLHLHNTWLQMIADHGLIAWFLIAHTLALVRPRNVASSLALIVYSFVQFGLFGKISLINIVFYYLVRKPNRQSSLFVPFRRKSPNRRPLAATQPDSRHEPA